MGSVDHRVRSTPRTTVRHRIPVPTSTTSLERRGPAPTVDVLPRGGGGLWGPIDRRAAFARAHRRSRASRRSSSGIHRLNRTVLSHSATHTQRSRRTASSICVARPGVFPETRRSFFSRPAAIFSAGLDRAKERPRREFRLWGRLNREPLVRLGAKAGSRVMWTREGSQSFAIQVSATWVTEFHLAAVH